MNRGDVNRGDGEFDIYMNKKNKMAYLRKKCVIILDEGMLFFYKFAHDFKSFC